jgi:hypothetical protein
MPVSSPGTVSPPAGQRTDQHHAEKVAGSQPRRCWPPHAHAQHRQQVVEARERMGEAGQEAGASPWPGWAMAASQQASRHGGCLLHQFALIAAPCRVGPAGLARG